MYVCLQLFIKQFAPLPCHQPVLQYRVRQKHLTAIWNSKTSLPAYRRFRADSHHTLLTCEVLRALFPCKLIYRSADFITWSARSPHSAIPDYFLSGEAHATRHANTDALKQRIWEFISNPHGSAKTCYVILSIATAGAYWESWWLPRSCIQIVMINMASQGHIMINMASQGHINVKKTSF